MIKRTLDECRGKFKDGRWELRNLKFLEEFMRQMEVSTGDVAKALGLTRNAVTRWFIYDNTSVVNAEKVAAVYGYELVISYAGKRARKPKIENTTLVIENLAAKKMKEIDLTRRLAFIRVAMAAYGKSVEDVAAALQVRRDAVMKIFQIDDTSFFNIYRIAEEFGWRVNVTFREKKKTTEEAADAETPAAEAPMEETPKAE